MPGSGVPKVRLDALLVGRGLAPTRQKAQALVLAGRVRVGGQVVDKPGKLVAVDADVTVASPEHPWVSRGGVKLTGALASFGVSPQGKRCLDIGASTGGFTHVLLAGGAREVVAVDVGKGQLHWSLRQDPRVQVVEGINARYLKPEDVGGGVFDLITVDVSFISVRLILPRLLPLLAAGGLACVLVKPQFEVGRGGVGKGGVVRDPQLREAAIQKVIAESQALGFEVLARCASPLPGPAGNLEEFVLFGRG
ncbi:16S/23S rRNA (cytidine-2'-O)-methyltransferase TlyA [bacterium HR09]|nr:16S/23S rRNA (cytidine-2'-O)-methyltransferase TlyA [bacterium HR09]